MSTHEPPVQSPSSRSANRGERGLRKLGRLSGWYGRCQDSARRVWVHVRSLQFPDNLPYGLPAGRVRQAWGGATGAFANLFFPPRCALCDGEVGDPSDPVHLCDDCRAPLQPAPERRCLRCAAPVPAAQIGDARDCPFCRPMRLHFEKVWTLGDYQGAFRDAILRAKHPLGQPVLAAMGAMLVESEGAALADWAPEALVPVPMHWSRRIERGANAAEYLATRLSQPCNARVERRAVRRHKATAPQGSLSPQQRRTNVRGAFRLNPRYDWRGAKVLLIDDVLTTGATANEIARLLKRAGAQSVAVAVLARGTGRR